MTVVIAAGHRWVADRDGIAHAHPERGRAIRTLCRLPAIDEQFARPAIVRCPICSGIAAGRATESELRFAWGDR